MNRELYDFKIFELSVSHSSRTWTKTLELADVSTVPPSVSFGLYLSNGGNGLLKGGLSMEEPLNLGVGTLPCELPGSVLRHRESKVNCLR